MRNAWVMLRLQPLDWPTFIGMTIVAIFILMLASEILKRVEMSFAVHHRCVMLCASLLHGGIGGVEIVHYWATDEHTSLCLGLLSLLLATAEFAALAVPQGHNQGPSVVISP
jgi:hypothetical protein